MIVDTRMDDQQKIPTPPWSKDSELDKSLSEHEIRELLSLSEIAIDRSRRYEVRVNDLFLDREGDVLRTLNVELLHRQSIRHRPTLQPSTFALHARKVLYAFHYSESLQLLALGFLALLGFSTTAIALGQPLYLSVTSGTKYILTVAGVGAGIFASAFLIVQATYRTRSFLAKIAVYTAAVLMAAEVYLLLEFVFVRFADHG